MAVTILVMTYNHRQFIERALDSALAQQIDEPWEILISEDCSTDGTREVVQDYGARHPKRIRLLLSPHNLRSNAVVARGIHASQARYVALLDGDDYWSCEHKLALQTQFLDAHPEYAICFHNVLIVDQRGSARAESWNGPSQPPTSGLHELVRGNFMATSSVMYRRALVPHIPDWYDDFFPITDWPLHLLYAEQGRIGYLDQVLGAYRLHDAGWYSPLTSLQKLESIARFYRRMSTKAPRSLARRVREGCFDFFWQWAEEYRRRGEIRRALRCLRWSWCGAPYRSARASRKFLSTLGRCLVGRSSDGRTRPDARAPT